MRLQDLDQISDLKVQLDNAERILAAFKAVTGDTVRCFARTDSNSRYVVELPPIAKSTAVSAAERERSKIIAQLAQLGVTVSPTQECLS